MSNLRIKLLLAGSVFSAAVGAANAGGLERGGYNIDLLFDPARFASEAAVTYVMPQRDLNNVKDGRPQDGNLNGRPSNGIRDTESYAVPRVGVKGSIGDADCMFDYSQPWGAHSNPGLNWAGANSNIETKINSNNYGLTCSYKFDVGRGQLRAIGGVFYQELDGFKERLVLDPTILPPLPFPFNGNGIGRLDLETDGVGWRIGAAYEIEEIALRASLVYNSEVKLDSITGTLDLTELPPLPSISRYAGKVTDVSGSAAMPQTLEFKLQSGIAPGWLAYGSVKWVDWSVLQEIPFYAQGDLAPATILALLYQDGWTVNAGIAHKFNDMWSGAAGITWDKGTMTNLGTSTDTWTFSAGASFTPNENVEFRFGGALGILTSGASTNDDPLISQRVTYDYDNDFVGAISASAKIKF